MRPTHIVPVPRPLPVDSSKPAITTMALMRVPPGTHPSYHTWTVDAAVSGMTAGILFGIGCLVEYPARWIPAPMVTPIVDRRA
jgi:hypothetical protein